ncbi:hypothetical protein BKA82DRAFT_24291 [Pisolithus tinctorius]|nr:hypothetical protein BKA82DRAFT_24291 [Pisolithus tinctorius]
MQQPSLAVNELAEARAVLATLERRERELTAELNDVRAALDLQRHKSRNPSGGYLCLLSTASQRDAFANFRVNPSGVDDLDFRVRRKGVLAGVSRRRIVIRLLDLVVTCAERWRSLTVLSDASFSASLVLGRFNPPHQFDLLLLRPECAPRIEDIYLSGEIGVLMGCEIPSSVKTLALRLYLPFQSESRLTSLCLEGDGSIDFGQLPPNSLRFPLLESSRAKLLTCAIVAPRLKRFHGRWLRSFPSLQETFAGAIGKFSNVDHLDLHRDCWSRYRIRDHTIAILRSAESSHTPNYHGYLEELNLKAFIDELAGCLGRRREAGLSKLRLYFPTPFLAERISFVYERLNDECILECAYDTQYQTLGGDRWQVVVGDDCVFGTDIASMLYADV